MNKRKNTNCVYCHFVLCNDRNESKVNEKGYGTEGMRIDLRILTRPKNYRGISELHAFRITEM